MPASYPSIEEQAGLKPPTITDHYNGRVKLAYYADKHEYRVSEDNGDFVTVPSVTTVLDILDAGKSGALIGWAVKKDMDALVSSIFPPEVDAEQLVQVSRVEFEAFVKEAKSAHRRAKEAAADIGSAAHAWLEEYGKLRISGRSHSNAVASLAPPTDIQVRTAVNSALNWIDKNDVHPEQTEVKIYSKNMKYAGTTDWIGFVNGRRSLIDFKTSNDLRLPYVMQIAAYQIAYQEEHNKKIEQNILLRLGKDKPEFEPVIYDVNGEYTDEFHAFYYALVCSKHVGIVMKREKQRKDLLKQESGNVQ